MSANEYYKIYYDNLLEEVEDKEHDLHDYCLMLGTLVTIPFIYSIPMDKNRETDGLTCRYDHLAAEFGERQANLLTEAAPVSVFEMLFALSRRMENDILCDPVSGIDNSNKYFWEMIRNLDIEKYDNSNFKEENIRLKVDNWLKRGFKRDGSGSIFPCPGTKRDKRNEEIWIMMQEYIMRNY